VATNSQKQDLAIAPIQIHYTATAHTKKNLHHKVGLLICQKSIVLDCPWSTPVQVVNEIV
jgi:hypothetical protein